MPYPSSVDTGQIQPWILGEIADLNNAQANTRTANNCYFNPTRLDAHAVLMALRTQIGTAGNGHIQLGVYDEGKNLLYASASTTTTTGIMTLTLATPLPLAPGRYYLSLWIDNAVDQTYSAELTTAGAGPGLNGVNAGGLPALMTTANPVNFHRRMAIVGLIQGGWS
jgi:hypothetical protein